MENAEELLRILTKGDVSFVVVGGVAAIFHGSPFDHWIRGIG